MNEYTLPGTTPSTMCWHAFALYICHSLSFASGFTVIDYYLLLYYYYWLHYHLTEYKWSCIPIFDSLFTIGTYLSLLEYCHFYNGFTGGWNFGLFFCSVLSKRPKVLFCDRFIWEENYLFHVWKKFFSCRLLRLYFLMPEFFTSKHVRYIVEFKFVMT